MFDRCVSALPLSKTIIKKIKSTYGNNLSDIANTNLPETDHYNLEVTNMLYEETKEFSLETDYKIYNSPPFFIDSLSPSINILMPGGFICGHFYEIYGSNGIGKTNLIYQLIISMLLKINNPDIMHIYYIDYLNTFCNEKFCSMGSKIGGNEWETIIQSPKICEYFQRICVFNVNDLMATLYHLEDIYKCKPLQVITSNYLAYLNIKKKFFLCKKPYSVIFLPKITDLLWIFITDYKKRYDITNSIMNLLHKLTLKYNLTIIITSNNVSKFENGKFVGHVSPLSYWSKKFSTRIIMFWEELNRCMMLEHSNTYPLKRVFFEIKDELII